ncbi:hypothetical protein NE619_08520 [Anaerovorax odorimutans]|uniref:Uncharacterized protein n=1 Tax=Anaerovorax odorimutans TaxID=109327 RepID=A0ABT1RNM5_9FIRM|nr:hypothetical protein [Anaerovorax odorimutans]MCQ4636773.1 hypothetical protein [Anaerovorax odorimutans]
MDTLPDECYDWSIEEKGEVPPEGEEGVICEDASDEENSIQPRAINYFSVTFNKLSSTRAQANIKASATTSTNILKSTVYLQKKNSKGKYVNVGGSVRTKKVSGRTLSHKPVYAINSDSSYQIKCVLFDGSAYRTKYRKL